MCVNIVLVHLSQDCYKKFSIVLNPSGGRQSTANGTVVRVVVSSPLLLTRPRGAANPTAGVSPLFRLCMPHALL